MPKDLGKLRNALTDLLRRATDESGEPRVPKDESAKIVWEKGLVQDFENAVPNILRSTIRPQDAFSIHPLNAAKTILALVAEKEILDEILGAYKTWDEKYERNFLPHSPRVKMRDEEEDQMIHRANGLTLGPAFQFSRNVSRFSFRPDTSIELRDYEIVRLLTTGRVPIDRMRKCRVCSEIFWAKRIDAATCSRPCLNSDNQRRTRLRKMLDQLQEFGASQRRRALAAKKEVFDLSDKIRERAKKYGLERFFLELTCCSCYLPFSESRPRSTSEKGFCRPCIRSTRLKNNSSRRVKQN